MAGICGPAQASPRDGHGGFVTLGAAASLEGAERNGGPLGVRGLFQTVEAGWLIPGGTIFLFEAGLFGGTRARGSEARLAQQVGLFGGVRVDLLEEPGLFYLVPYVRGGLSASWIEHEGDKRAGLGPYFDFGLRRHLFAGVSVTIAATGRANVAPFSVAVGGSFAISVQSP